MANAKVWTLSELRARPTLSASQFDNLKVDLGEMRVWLSRMTVADGMPYNNQVTVEILLDGRWCTFQQYEAAYD